MEDVMQLIDGGASPDQVLTVWEDTLHFNLAQSMIEKLNSMLIKCVELDNTALAEAICSHRRFQENVHELPWVESVDHCSGGAAYHAVCANNIVLAKIMHKAGYHMENVFQRSDKSDIGPFLVSEKVYKLVMDREDTEVIMSTWEHDHADDSNVLKDEQCQWMLCMCVEQNNIKLAEVLCQLYMNGKKCHYHEYLFPLKYARQKKNDAIVRCLLRAGMDPHHLFDDFVEASEYLAKQYLCEEVQILVDNKASGEAIMETWEMHHSNDLPNVRNEQLNWLLINSIQQNNLDFAKLICGHHLFPEKPSHRYMSNSPLYKADIQNEDVISLLLQAGYDPSDKHDDLHSPSLLEEALMSNDLEYIRVIMVDHQANVKDRLSLLHAVCSSCDATRLDRFLALGIYTPLDMNTKTATNTYPIFMVGTIEETENEPIEDSIQVMLKHGADPCLVDEKKGTLLEHLCSWLRLYCEPRGDLQDNWTNNKIISEWENPFELIQLLLDQGVGFSETRCCEPLRLFFKLSLNDTLDRAVYDKLFSQLIQISPKMAIDAMFTHKYLNMVAKLHSEDAVEMMKHVYAKVEILVNYGATWDDIAADKLLYPGHDSDIIGRLSNEDSSLRRIFPSYVTDTIYKQSVSYILKLFPFAAKQVVQCPWLFSKFICLLSGDLDLFGPFLETYLDFLPSAEKSHVVERLVETLDEDIMDPHTKASLTQWLQSCLFSTSLMKAARIVVNERLSSTNKLHRVTELELPPELHNFLQYNS